MGHSRDKAVIDPSFDLAVRAGWRGLIWQARPRAARNVVGRGRSLADHTRGRVSQPGSEPVDPGVFVAVVPRRPGGGIGRPTPREFFNNHPRLSEREMPK